MKKGIKALIGVLLCNAETHNKGELKSSDSLYFGNTPNTILSSGLNELPLAFTQKDFRKSTQKKHNIPRRALKSLNENLGNAMFSFGDGKKIGFIVPDVDGNGKPLLIAVEGDIQMDRQPVNAIKSMYGLDNPKEWLENQIKSRKHFVLYNEKRSNAFLQTYGYMATVGEGIKPSSEIISQPNEFVNASEKVSLSERNKNYESADEVNNRLDKKYGAEFINSNDIRYSSRETLSEASKKWKP